MPGNRGNGSDFIGKFNANPPRHRCAAGKARDKYPLRIGIEIRFHVFNHRLDIGNIVYIAFGDSTASRSVVPKLGISENILLQVGKWGHHIAEYREETNLVGLLIPSSLRLRILAITARA